MTETPIDELTERYEKNDTPWDTGITPPEIVDIVAELPPGRAIDLGCGTGTNVRYLLEHGWQADGVDFVALAIDRAKAKLADFPAADYGVYCHDVTRLASLDSLRPPYDLAIDIGCGHGVLSDSQEKYAADVAGLLKPGGAFMLYAHSPNAERDFGWTSDDVKRLFTPYFDIVWQALSDDTSTGMPSGWYRLGRKSAED